MSNLENYTLEEIETKFKASAKFISKNYYCIPVKKYCSGLFIKELHLIISNSGKIKKYMYRFDIS